MKLGYMGEALYLGSKQSKIINRILVNINIMSTEEFNFKQALEELKKINEEFDSEDIDLDEALKKFKRGLELAKKCKERLREVENEVVKIKEKFSNTKNEDS